jgi:hypothetical protein
VCVCVFGETHITPPHKKRRSMDVDFVVLLPCEGGGGVSRRLVPPLQHVLPTEHQRQRSFAQQPPPPPLTYIPEILTIVRNGWVRRHCRREVSSGAIPTDDGRTNTYPAKLVCVLQVERKPLIFMDRTNECKRSSRDEYGTTDNTAKGNGRSVSD